MRVLYAVLLLLSGCVPAFAGQGPRPPQGPACRECLPTTPAVKAKTKGCCGCRDCPAGGCASAGECGSPACVIAPAARPGNSQDGTSSAPPVIYRPAPVMCYPAPAPVIYSQPAYAPAPVYSAPVYSQPAYSQPTYSAPPASYSAPTYSPSYSGGFSSRSSSGGGRSGSC